MNISDLSIRRPVFATVVSLLLIVLGIMAFSRLTLRELPAIDPPIVPRLRIWKCPISGTARASNGTAVAISRLRSTAA
ncbi:MAG: efflux RND transporter permease subunit [Proteobacteria bacterium]|nr:efflux RND transporter permease subunit [Pseudomonadota bacterium]